MPIVVDDYLFGQWGSWADDTHFAAQDIDELRQLVEAPAPQCLADLGEPWIVRHFEHPRIGVFDGTHQFGPLFVGTLDHASELETGERRTVTSNPRLTKQHRTR